MTDQPKLKELSVVVEQAGLQPSKIDSLMMAFSQKYQEARTISDESKDIVVTDESQTDLMLKAREARLKLKSIRVEVEHIRTELKEQSLREGRAIDGLANVIKALIVPVEENLEKQEKYIETRELERINKRYEQRIEALKPYVTDITFYSIKDLSDEAFDNLLNSSKQAWQLQRDIEVKAEQERQEKIRKDELERNRKMELAPYIAFIKRSLDGLRDMDNNEYDTILGQAKAAKVEYDKEQQKIRQENEQLRKKEEESRKAKEAAEEKLRLEREEIARKEKEVKAAEDVRKAAEEKAAKDALLAPDKEKLMYVAELVDGIKLPAVSSRQAQIALEYIENKLFSLSNEIREKAREL